MNLKNLIREEVLSQMAYPAEAPSCKIKLDANENPFTLPTPLKDSIFEAMKKIDLNRYPEPGSHRLRTRFAGYYGVEEDMLMIGNGSDELIHILCTALTGQTLDVIIPVPTFAMYSISALNNGHRVIGVPLDASFDLDVDAILRHLATTKTTPLIFLSYPNNPTGNCFSQQKIEAIIEQSTGIVVVDEAYFPFSGKTFLPFLNRYENLVILRTLSKIGLAAMRIGFLIGPASLIHELDKVRLPYNLNALSQVVAGFYLDNEATFLKQAEEIINMREELFKALKEMEGVHPYPSEANFIFFSCDFDVDSVYNNLLAKGILIKNFNAPGIMRNCMRVTVGNREENEEFLAALKGIIAKVRRVV
ncbi:MAG: histidinol-phosphate transaminase [Syntrophales bacterium]|nr:histidinol-phosphate transaminase [Syntrophales bacterium]